MVECRRVSPLTRAVVGIAATVSFIYHTYITVRFVATRVYFKNGAFIT